MIAKPCLILLLAALLQCASCETVGGSDIQPPEMPAATATSAHFVSFTKRLYSALGRGSVKDVAVEFKGEYETLNYDGKLGEKLRGLYEMRQIDLQTALAHAKQMKEVLQALAGDVEAKPEEPKPVEAKPEEPKPAEPKVEDGKPPAAKVQAAQAALSSAQSATADAKSGAQPPAV
jgi:hypothetical protein